ncbi:VOC family protein [Actinomadura rudentiformis]|uniref:VOC family protein n=1 Tax=Actinomadura rudentiformis TaxID=359158 RepID=A0A6H9Z2Q6_9ACTN|nr:VOC family protein [Actinomadura rudentiformis]KAB2347477.1 VOC family protein [Actinomadura rudentiformis]
MTDLVLDHLVYATPDLKAAVSDIAARTGVTPVEGGPHPGLGTRNHLLGLGGNAYLEVIGPDPDQADPEGPRPFGIDDLTAPALVAWAAGTTELDASVERARAAGHDPGPSAGMSRLRPDGELLSWRLTPPRTGVLPFLIDWGETDHPAGALPVVPLLSFEAVHPDPESVRGALAALGARLTVRKGPGIALIARLDGPVGPVTLD